MEKLPDSAEPFVFDPGLYPEAAGCFLIRDRGGRIIYAGKAVNLRRRLAQMFAEGAFTAQEPRPLRFRYLDTLPQMIARTHSIACILMEDAEERARWVNEQIRDHRPMFNFATFLEKGGTSCIVRTGEAFPRFLPLSQKRVSKALEQAAQGSQPRGQKGFVEHFGPYPSALRDRLIECANEAFGLRTCDSMPQTACVLYRQQRCSAPCEGRISAEDYAQRVVEAGECLREPAKLIEVLAEHMRSAAEEMDFERAGRIRDQIQALDPLIRRQKYPGV